MNTTISSANFQVNPEHVIAATVAPSAFDGDFLVVPSYCEGFKQQCAHRFDSIPVNVGTLTNVNFVDYSVLTYSGRLRTDSSKALCC